MMAGGWIADRLRGRYGNHKSRALVAATGMCAGGALILRIATEEVAGSSPGWRWRWHASRQRPPIWNKKKSGVELGGPTAAPPPLSATPAATSASSRPIVTPLFAAGLARVRPQRQSRLARAIVGRQRHLHPGRRTLAVDQGPTNNRLCRTAKKIHCWSRFRTTRNGKL